MNFKKILAAVLSIVLLLCLAACGGKTATPAPSGGTVQTVKPDADGMIYLSMGAEIKLNYDKNGNILSVEPANEAGQELLAEAPVGTGVACNVAAADLVKAAVADTDLKVIIIKQAFGSSSPSKEFLSAIATDAEAAAGSCKVITVSVDELTAEGYLSIDTVKAIFMASIGVESAVVTVTEEQVNGIYYLSHKDGNVTSNYTVDADTGIVAYVEDEPVVDIPVEEETLAEEFIDPEANVPSADEFYVEEIPETEPVFPDDMTGNDDTIEEPTTGEETGGEEGAPSDQEEPDAVIPDDAPTA